MISAKRFKDQRQALGSLAEVMLTDIEPQLARQTMQSVWAVVDQFNHRFSRFLPTSELSTFNDHAGDDVDVSAEFAAMLATCMQYHELSEGIFNPFVLPDLQRAGYIGSWPSPQLVADQPDYSSRQRGDMADLIVVNNSQAHIPAETALDFGGIGKGYLLDQLAQHLQERAVVNYCIALGGDVLCRGFDIDGQPWRIGVTTNRDTAPIVAIATNTDGQPLAAASSAVLKRKGQGWHHLIDPRTGRPSNSPVIMATVLARTGVMADVMAKTLVIEPSFNADRLHRLTLGTYLQLSDGRKLLWQQQPFIKEYLN